MAARSTAAATFLCAPGSAAADPSLAPSTAFGTGNGPLRYGINTRCSKRPPVVRDAFSEAFGVKNRLLRYGRDIRCSKQASVVRDESSKELGAKNSLLWYAANLQRHTEQPTPQTVDSLLPHWTHFQCAKRPRSLCSLRPLPPFHSSR